MLEITRKNGFKCDLKTIISNDSQYLWINLRGFEAETESKPQSHEKNIKVEIDLTNYATKEDIKNIAHVDTWSFALKTNLSSLKTEVDKLDIKKLVPVPTDLSKLSNVVKNDVVKKAVYNKLAAKVTLR